MKLKLEHLAPYLPHKIDFACIDPDSGEWTDNGIGKINFRDEILEVGNMEYVFDDIGGPELKPILRPLSDIDKPFTHTDGFSVNLFEKYDEIGRDLSSILEDERWVLEFPYFIVEDLIKHHFDVFGLIGRGLVININDVEHLN